MSRASADQGQIRVEVAPPIATHSAQVQYGNPSQHAAPVREVYDPSFEMRQIPMPSFPEFVGEAEFPDEPKKLFVYDEDRGRLDCL